MNSPTKVMVAMSGGVDSSVAAFLLSRDGHRCIGATMCLGITDANGRAACCGPQAVTDAKKVCDQLDIPHYALDFSRQLHEYVITDFISEYRHARTPNPCVRCNRYLKFQELFNYAKSCGYPAIATGHYAKTGTWDGHTVLMRNRDTVKDQSYFLYSIPADVLDGIIFPLSELTKEQVRTLAAEAGLHVASKAESQEICFITDNNYRNFLRRNGVCDAPGTIVDTMGNLLGRHAGIFHYTIGQRKGLGVATGTPLYVIALDADTHRVVLGRREELTATGLDAHSINLFVARLPDVCTAKVRYAQKDVPCTAFIDNGILSVTFAEPVEAVTPGQSVVLYHGAVVLGGGLIRNVFR